MKQDTIQPFYFPTTVVFVDDSAPFLANLSLQLNPQLAFKLFHSPFSALSALNHEHAVTPIDSNFFHFMPTAKMRGMETMSSK
jgi:hypothetical protein